MAIHILTVITEDRVVWGPTKSGEYSMKSGYKQALIRQFTDHYRPDSNLLVWKTLWQPKIPPKWVLFVWKCLYNILPVKWELKKKKREWLLIHYVRDVTLMMKPSNICSLIVPCPEGFGEGQRWVLILAWVTHCHSSCGLSRVSPEI
ncbi:hypothetical protein CsSME_00048066 [Camellia sinensis var. sinensis]